MGFGESDALVTGFWVITAIEVLGICGMLAARLFAPAQGQVCCLMGILLVGSASITAVYCGSGMWASSGATLAMIAVGATWERGGGSHAGEW